MRLGILSYRFSGFELDSATGWLTFGQQRVHLSHAQARVLLHLIANAPHIVSRKALAEAGWGGTASDDSIERRSSTYARRSKPIAGSSSSRRSPTRATASSRQSSRCEYRLALKRITEN